MSEHRPYIYKVTCLPTGKTYIGSRTMVGKNSSEFWQAGGYFTSSKVVEDLRTQYGDDAWDIEIVREYTEWEDIKDVVADEHACIREFVDTHGKDLILNMCWYEDGAKVFSVAGRARTDEEREHLSRLNKGKPVRDDVKARISASHTGRKLPDAVKAKIGDAHRGKTVSLESRAKISATKKASKREMPEDERIRRSQSVIGIPKPVVTCPHCNKSGGRGVMGRWHFDNCKSLKP